VNCWAISNRPLKRTRLDSSLDGITSSAKRIITLDALNLPASQFLKPPLSLGEPWFFSVALDFIIKNNESYRIAFKVKRLGF